MGKFRITDHRGFQLLLDNGLTLSTQFGVGSYCERHPHPTDLAVDVEDYSAPRESDNWESKDAEVAIWDEEGEWITDEMIADVFSEEEYETQVKGWVTMDKWLEVLDWCREYKEVQL